MSKTEQNADENASTEERTNLRFGKDAPDESDPCEGDTHMGSPVVMTAVGHRDDPVREAKVCSECQTVHDEGTWENARGVVVEGESETLARRTNVETDHEESHEIPLADVLDDIAVRVTHAGIRDGELLLKTQKQANRPLTVENEQE
ncbi:hypothetical protein [Halorussus salinus]|uniref:hypothetical protein n=1 Tax=Halorussus salinus TaxID=1364935 RepID=UPI001092BC13|nr:hypothetical protein [Halorussus salinus]